MKGLINNVKLGADPEVFLIDTNTGKVISAEGIIGGTKDSPKKISEVGHCVQEDNVMAEFNIPPAIDKESFSKDIQFVIDYLNESTHTNTKVLIAASAELESHFLETPQAKMFGCDPDFNVWLRGINESPSSESTLRTCGGHIHIGYENPEMEKSEEIIRFMDLYLGVPSILMDTDTRRREMYGKAGCFRFKSYGVEYRTLSNFWVASNELREWAFENTMLAVKAVNNKDAISDKLATELVECINTQNKTMAMQIIKEFNIPILETKQVLYEKVISE